MQFRELTLDEVVYIHKNYMLDDFGADEVKPVERMVEMQERNAYAMYGLFEKETLMAYAFLCGDLKEPVVLLDYLAVMKAARGQGIGTRMLKMLGEELSLGGLLIESEAVEYAKDAEDAKVREKRLDFYYKAGAHNTIAEANLWGVHYQVVYLPYKSQLTPEQEYEHLERIYMDMFTEYHRANYAFWNKKEMDR